jgi:hypothetical protein
MSDLPIARVPDDRYSDGVRVTHTPEAEVTITTTIVNGTVRATGGDPGGTARAGIRLFLHKYAGGACVVCGQATRLDAPNGAEDRAEAGHLLPGHGGSKTGWQEGNLANVCRICNEQMSDRDCTPYVSAFALPHLIPATWPQGWRNRAATRSEGTHRDMAVAACNRIFG